MGKGLGYRVLISERHFNRWDAPAIVEFHPAVVGFLWVASPSANEFAAPRGASGRISGTKVWTSCTGHQIAAVSWYCFNMPSLMKKYLPAHLASFLCVLLIAHVVSAEAGTEPEPFDPTGIFLTWRHDPTTSMTIDWHTLPVDRDVKSSVDYRIEGSDDWTTIGGGTKHDFPFSERTIHRIDLRGLEPGTTYEFRFGEDSKVYRFRTMPSDISQSPLRFAVGGDTGAGEIFRKMNRKVMEYDPDFIVWGGDLAYADGDPDRLNRWHAWFDGIKETLIDSDGRIVPVVVALGNHEIFNERRLLRRLEEAEAQKFLNRHNLWDFKPTYFFHLFAFPDRPGYNFLDIGEYMSLVILDTGHHSSVLGPQTGWLGAVLEARRDRPHVFPVYHVPAYPSHRTYQGLTANRVRENWVPLFDEHNVRVVFEHHDHTYKRTKPIRGGEVSEDGIVYIGDGAWGDVGIRDGGSSDEWYIEKFASKNHAIIVTLLGDDQDYKVVTPDGEIIDRYKTRR